MLTSCETPGKLLNLSVLPFPHLGFGENALHLVGQFGVMGGDYVVGTE